MKLGRFSLRILVVILTGLCVFLGYRAYRTRVQRDALRELRESGFEVVWTFWDGQTNQSPKFFSETKWLSIDKFGEHSLSSLSAFSRLQSLSFSNADCTLERLRTLPELPSVQDADFAFCPLGDKGVGVVAARLSNLKDLDLQSSGISDMSIAHLRTLHRLERLDLSSNTDLTGAMPQQSLCLPHLSHLNLDYTSATDKTVESLVTSLVAHLSLNSTRVTPNAIPFVAKI